MKISQKWIFMLAALMLTVSFATGLTACAGNSSGDNSSGGSQGCG